MHVCVPAMPTKVSVFKQVMLITWGPRMPA